jgi:hypothetical protein
VQTACERHVGRRSTRNWQGRIRSSRVPNQPCATRSTTNWRSNFMALDFSELNGFAPDEDRVPFDPRMITGFTGARSGQSPSPTALPTFGQMIGSRTTAVATPARLAPDAPAPSFSSLMQPATPTMLGVDGVRQHLGRPDVDGARQYLSRTGWAGKLPPAHQERIRQYLWRAGWDGKSEPTQELKDKAYQLSRPDKESF